MLSLIYLEALEPPERKLNICINRKMGITFQGFLRPRRFQWSDCQPTSGSWTPPRLVLLCSEISGKHSRCTEGWSSSPCTASWGPSYTGDDQWQKWHGLPPYWTDWPARKPTNNCTISWGVKLNGLRGKHRGAEAAAGGDAAFNRRPLYWMHQRCKSRSSVQICGILQFKLHHFRT